MALCLGCMRQLPHPDAACPNCGWSKSTDQNQAHQLKQGYSLKNLSNNQEYIIGKVIGQGGFGIVYIAWDCTNNQRVAIKEFFPSSILSRQPNSANVILTQNNSTYSNFFSKQKERFQQEFDKMKLFQNDSSVVNVMEFFEANGTAYIVMEFVEGNTFMTILEAQHKLPLQTVLFNLEPIINLLEKMHSTDWRDRNGNLNHGIIHRDISPDNIIYSSDGSVKLLDFGTAKVPAPGSQPILKHGYAPWEQYLSQAPQGSWTDVYALAATIYRAITGEVPIDALQRSTNDTLKPPSALGVPISSYSEQALLKGLAVQQNNRYQTVRELYNALLSISTRPLPELSLSPWTKNGSTHSATINYNGDGVLSTTLGTISGNILTVVTDAPSFFGSLSASEGAVYAATAIDFSYPDNNIAIAGGTSKPVPMLSLTPWTKNGSTYTALINYSGDGFLSTSLGNINNNLLTVTSANANFFGTITASEGATSAETFFNFEHHDNGNSKVFWIVAAVAIVIAFVFYGKMSEANGELNIMRKQLAANEQRLENIAEFEKYYGFGSANYFADKALFFAETNSEIKISIYCGLDLTGEDYASFAVVKGNELLEDSSWETPFDSETRKANIILKTGNQSGFVTLRLDNTVNDEIFDVLVVIQ